jgi:hypothetical protein
MYAGSCTILCVRKNIGLWCILHIVIYALEGKFLIKMDNFPCKVIQVQSRWSPGWQSRLFTTKTVFVFNKWGSQAMSAGANPMNFWPIWLFCIQKCIFLDFYDLDISYTADACIGCFRKRAVVTINILANLHGEHCQVKLSTYIWSNNH